MKTKIKSWPPTKRGNLCKSFKSEKKCLYLIFIFGPLSSPVHLLLLWPLKSMTHVLVMRLQSFLFFVFVGVFQKLKSIQSFRTTTVEVRNAVQRPEQLMIEVKCSWVTHWGMWAEKNGKSKEVIYVFKHLCVFCWHTWWVLAMTERKKTWCGPPVTWLPPLPL